MNTRRTFSIFTLLITLSMFFTTMVSAQRTRQDPTVTAAVDTGDPGLSFRYVETYGHTEEAYVVNITDTHHLNGPNGLFVDASDNLYVAEETGARLLKYRTSDSARLLSIGTAGLQIRGETTFDHPLDIAVDSNGDIWTVDRHRVAQYDASGNFLQEFPAGDPRNSGDDNSHFDEPRGLAFDDEGRLYVADDLNHRVQVYSVTVGSSLVYSTTLGETGVTGSDDGHFNRPAQIAFDSSGRLYVTDVMNYRVQRCTYAGGWNCSTFHGTGSSGNGSDELFLAFGLHVDDSDNVFIADAVNGRVKKCDTSGACTVFATGIEWPADVTTDSAGHVYVSDFYDFTIREYDSSGTAQGTFVGILDHPYVTDMSHFNAPYGIAVDALGNLFLTEHNGHRLINLDASGTPQWTIGEAGIFGSDDTHFGGFEGGPAAVAVDSTRGAVYIADPSNHRVQKCTEASGCTTFAGVTGEWGTDNDHLNHPYGVALDADGNVYIADRDNQRVQKCTPEGTCTTFAGVTGTSGSDNVHFDGPLGVAVDDADNVYVADNWNRRVQKCTSGGDCTTFAGTTGVWGSDFDHLSQIRDVAVDGQGRVYVADTYNQRVQVYDNTGAYLTTLGGQWGAGVGRMRQPAGVTVDGEGNVYVTDLVNHNVQKFAPGVPDWQQANVNGFGSPDNTCASTFADFQDTLYVGTTNDGDQGGEVWRYDKPGWTRVSAPGFGNVQNQHVRGTTVFNGYLYAGTTNEDTGAEIWRSSDGETWSQVASGGFGDANNIEINHLAVFGNALYANTSNSATGTEIWRSTTGDPGSWTQANDDGFNDADNAGSWFMKTFDGDLYVGTNNQSDGGEIWRTPDGTNWTKITEGFGDTDNEWVHTFAVFGNQIYASTGNWADGGEIWRSSTGNIGDWTQVVSGGFDAPYDNDVIRLAGVHSGYLYATTANWSTGQEIWRTEDGASWEQVNPDGFGDSSNFDPFWNDASIVYDGTLYVGTCNEAHGGEVWQQRLYQIFIPATTQNWSPTLSTWVEEFTVTVEATPPDPPQHSVHTFCVGDTNGTEHLVQLGSCDATHTSNNEAPQSYSRSPESYGRFPRGAQDRLLDRAIIQPSGGSIPLLLDDSCQTYDSGPAYDPVTYELGGKAEVTLSTLSSTSEGDVIRAEFYGVPCD